jgi:hypothetical protein
MTNHLMGSFARFNPRFIVRWHRGAGVLVVVALTFQFRIRGLLKCPTHGASDEPLVVKNRVTNELVGGARESLVATPTQLVSASKEGLEADSGMSLLHGGRRGV